MNHEMTVTTGVLLELKCSCGVVIMEAASAPLSQLEKAKWEHLTKHQDDWLITFPSPVMHGSCNSPECKWCNPPGMTWSIS